MNGIAALDDPDARKVSEKENIRLTGTLGIVKVGYELCPVKDMHELKNIIQELRGVWFRMSDDLEMRFRILKRSVSVHKQYSRY